MPKSGIAIAVPAVLVPTALLATSTSTNILLSVYTVDYVTSLLVESVITPTAVSFPPAIITGPGGDGLFIVRTNFSGPSIILSIITGTLMLLTVILLANVAVSRVELKSTPPVSQTLFSQH